MVEICGCLSVGSVICPSVRQWCWCLSLQRDWQTPTEIQTDTNTINCLSVSRLVSVNLFAPVNLSIVSVKLSIVFVKLFGWCLSITLLVSVNHSIVSVKLSCWCLSIPHLSSSSVFGALQLSNLSEQFFWKWKSTNFLLHFSFGHLICVATKVQYLCIFLKKKKVQKKTMSTLQHFQNYIWLWFCTCVSWG